MSWRSWSSTAWIVLAGVIGLLLVRGCTAPPAASPDDAPPEVFSSKRALAHTATILGDQTPHPPGSKANAAVRERVIEQVRGLGLEPEVQSTWVCPPAVFQAACGYVHNVIARIDGQEADGPSIVLSAHYDSIAASPGASDDGAGVGILLEIARGLLRDAPHRNPVELVISDGEEELLLGAVAWANHPRAKDVVAVVNLEASGSSGKSLLFQTGPREAWIVGLYADAAPQPATGSMLSDLYALGSNMTDFSVYAARGLDGANFAWTEDGQNYHTPLDDLAHLDERSVRHQGESAGALVAALADADLADRPEGALVYQDVLNLMVIGWPEWLNLGVVVLCVLGVAALVFVRQRRERATLRTWGWAWLGIVAALVLAMLVGLGAELGVGLGTDGHPTPWWASGGAFRWMYGAAALTGILGGGALLGRRTDPWGTWLAVWSGWALLTLLTGLLAPAFTAIFVLPLAVAIVAGGTAWMAGADRPPLAVPWLATLIVWIPVSDSLAEASFGSGALGVLPLAFTVSPLAPLLAQTPWIRQAAASLAGLVATLVLLGVVLVSPRADADHPVGISLVTVQDTVADRSWTHVEVSWHFAADPLAVLPPELAALVEPNASRETAADFGKLAFDPGAVASAKTAPSAALGPDVRLGADRTSAVLTSRRGATGWRICVNAGVTLPGGVKAEPLWDWADQDCHVYRFLGPHDGPLSLTLAPEDDELRLWAGDELAGVDPVAQALADARGPHVVPFHFGDRTIVGSWVRPEPEPEPEPETEPTDEPETEPAD